MVSKLKRALSASILLAGLGFCVVGLVRLQQQYPLHWSFTPGGALEIIVTAAAAIVATAYAWQRYMLAFVGERLALAEATYQTCVMLIGKYVPVMIGGFLARISANAKSLSTQRIVVATTVEQIGAMGAALGTGAACYALTRLPSVAALVVLACAVAVGFAPSMLALVLELFARLSARLRQAPRLLSLQQAPGLLRQALAFQFVQMIAMAAFIGAVVMLVVPAMTLHSSALISGAYLISVVVGIAVVFLPGGIGAREAAFVWLVSVEIGTPAALQLALALRIAMSILDLAAGAICAVVRATAPQRDREESE